jgi:hypothetical protein
MVGGQYDDGAIGESRGIEFVEHRGNIAIDVAQAIQVIVVPPALDAVGQSPETSGAHTGRIGFPGNRDRGLGTIQLSLLQGRRFQPCVTGRQALATSLEVFQSVALHRISDLAKLIVRFFRCIYVFTSYFLGFQVGLG